MKGTVAQMGEVLIHSIRKLSDSEKAAIRADLDLKFQAHDDARLLAMACSERVN